MSLFPPGLEITCEEKPSPAALENHLLYRPDEFSRVFRRLEDRDPA